MDTARYLSVMPIDKLYSELHRLHSFSKSVGFGGFYSDIIREVLTVSIREIRNEIKRRSPEYPVLVSSPFDIHHIITKEVLNRVVPIEEIFQMMADLKRVEKCGYREDLKVWVFPNEGKTIIYHISDEEESDND